MNSGTLAVSGGPLEVNSGALAVNGGSQRWSHRSERVKEAEVVMGPSNGTNDDRGKPIQIRLAVLSHNYEDAWTE